MICGYLSIIVHDNYLICTSKDVEFNPEGSNKAADLSSFVCMCVFILYMFEVKSVHIY